MNCVRPLPAVEARNICFTYPNGIDALADVSFHAMPGELVAVMGANGSGKTTLLKVLMRLLHPQQGEVRLGSTDVRQLAAAELYSRMGMVFQNPADQLFGASVEEDVAFGPRNLGLSEVEVARRVAEALEAVHAADLRRRAIQHLSFGQQRRVCLAGVLAMRPQVLILDEPTAGLDPRGETQMIDLLLQLRRREKTTLIVATHSVDVLPVHADRIYILDRGRIHMVGTPQEVFAEPSRMAEAGLRVPLIAHLVQELCSQRGVSLSRLPLTLPEARQEILQWLAGGGLVCPKEENRL